MVTPLRVDGVDISHHQGHRLDLAAAKRAGVKFLYHKATEGTTFTDPNYARRRAEAKTAGIPFGGYHFARPDGGDAVAEARHFLRVAAPKPGDLAPCLDLETSPVGIDIRAWAAQFVREVQRQVGVKPVVYTPFDLGAADDGCVIWRPRYNNDNRPPALRWDIWQFSNGVLGVPRTVPGIGPCDINHMRPGLTVADFTIPREKAEDMSKFTVRRRGTDSSGRPIFASDYMWDWWKQVCEAIGFEPTITQGAHMLKAGGGASASAGYHDLGGCFDLRVRDRSEAEVKRMVRQIRAHGAAAWLRNREHGGFSDPHIHLVLGTDRPLAHGAQAQWGQYLAGRDGLASNGPDYHWRPDPLVTVPPKPKPVLAFTVTAATVNFGRASHVRDVVTSMERVRDRLIGQGKPIVLFTQEIDEGDKTKPDDHTLLRQIFRWRKGWRKAHMTSRDPILTHGLERRIGHLLRAAKGLKRQTPARHITEVVVKTPGKNQPNIACLGGHYPAGAYNGQRPVAIKKELRERYDRMLELHRERIEHHLSEGRHVLWGMDVNNRKFPRLHDREMTLASHGPDLLRAIPAKGWEVHLGPHGAIQLDIERLHDCLFRVTTFTRSSDA